jgi:hypothetical protein
MTDRVNGGASFVLAANARTGAIVAAHDADDSASQVLAMT